MPVGFKLSFLDMCSKSVKCTTNHRIFFGFGIYPIDYAQISARNPKAHIAGPKGLLPQQ
jgi:hypothetical protein